MHFVRRLTSITYSHFFAEGLRRNSSLLIMSNAINTLGGFLFWLLCARLFAAQSVGLAVSIISFAAVASAFTNLGLPNTILRFLPTSHHKGSFFLGSLIIIFISSLVVAAAAMFLSPLILHDLRSIPSYRISLLILIPLVLCTSLGTFIDGTLMSFRDSQSIFRKSLIFSGFRVLLPPLLLALGLSGIIGAYAFALILGVSYGTLVALRRLILTEVVRPSFKELWTHQGFASANYLGGLFAVLSGTLLPIVVLARLGPSDAAYFYMPMQVAFSLNFITTATSQTMVAEASQTHSASLHSRHFRHATVHLYRTLVPAAIALIALGWPLLRLYGLSYAENGYGLLILLCVATMFVAVNWLGDAWLNIEERARLYLFMNGFNAMVVIACVYVFSSHGLLGVGVGYLLGQLISATVYFGILVRSHLVSRTPSVE